MDSRNNDWWRRAVRTGAQLLASGALLALTDQFVKDIPAQYAPYVLASYQVAVTAAQNYLEDIGAMKPLLKGKASSGANPVPGG